LVIGEVGYIQ